MNHQQEERPVAVPGQQLLQMTGAVGSGGEHWAGKDYYRLRRRRRGSDSMSHPSLAKYGEPF